MRCSKTCAADGPSGSGRLQEVLNIVISPETFWCLENCSLRRGGSYVVHCYLKREISKI